VRELQNVIERAVILASDGEDLQPEHLGMVPTGAVASASGSAAAMGVGGDAILPLSELEKRAILHAVEKCGGNRTQAAKKLEISIRTLRNKLHEYGFGAKEEAGEEEEAVG
jgi:DNA-binding NtrC family response regulator